MPKYFAIPSNIGKQIEDMITVKAEQLDKQFEDNIANESFVNNLIYQVNDTLIEHEIILAGKLRELRLKYITGNTDEKDISDVRVNRSEMDQVINGSREVQVLNQKIQELQNMMKFYDRTLSTLRNKNFTLRNILEYRKFMNGEN